jgi:hypothetical protein
MPTRNDELVILNDYVKSMDRKEFASVFKKLISIRDIELCSPERSISNRLAISPPKLEFLGDETRHISVINMYAGSIRVDALSSGSAVVRPQTAVLQQYSEMQFSVQLTGVSTTVEIKSEDGIVTVPIRRLKESHRSERKNYAESFKLQQKLIDFGLCEIGGVRKINASITSLVERTLSLRVRSLERSWKLNEKIFDLPTALRVPAFAKTEFLIEFRPSMDADFHESFVVECHDQRRKLRLVGRGIAAQKGLFVGADTQNLEFPSCEVGRIKRGRLRISNKSDARVNLLAMTAPPFFCPLTTFSVEPGCYVMLPVHFCPKASGSFSGSVRFRPDSSNTFSVNLRGTGILVDA